jgi:transposase
MNAVFYLLRTGCP